MAYIDPQCFKDKTFSRNEKSDIYALGVILWELSSGKIPFEHVESYLIPFEIKNGVREKAIRGVPAEYEDPEKRPTIQFVLETLNKAISRSNFTHSSDMSKTPLDQEVDDFAEVSSPV